VILQRLNQLWARTELKRVEAPAAERIP